MVRADLKKGEQLYEGKAKRVFSVLGNSDVVWMEFKDSLTAFNAQKKGEFEGKGVLNRNIASLIFRFLKTRGVESHWVADQGEREMVCRKVKIVPLEVVVRNRLAGSTAKKFNIPEGQNLNQPLVEFYYKDDALGDPFVSDDQALMLKVVETQNQLEDLKKLARQVNGALREMFDGVGIELIDFKLEFGYTDQGQLILADEISPDSCRLWDRETGEKLDKDRFRRDLGRVEESYQEVWTRLSQKWESKI